MQPQLTFRLAKRDEHPADTDIRCSREVGGAKGSAAAGVQVWLSAPRSHTLPFSTLDLLLPPVEEKDNRPGAIDN